MGHLPQRTPCAHLVVPRLCRSDTALLVPIPSVHQVLLQLRGSGRASHCAPPWTLRGFPLCEWFGSPPPAPWLPNALAVLLHQTCFFPPHFVSGVIEIIAKQITAHELSCLLRQLFCPFRRKSSITQLFYELLPPWPQHSVSLGECFLLRQRGPFPRVPLCCLNALLSPHPKQQNSPMMSLWPFHQSVPPCMHACIHPSGCVQDSARPLSTHPQRSARCWCSRIPPRCPNEAPSFGEG